MAGISRKQRKAILGKKLGMTQIFVEDGSVVPVTVLRVGPCAVLQVKTESTDGYVAFQLGFDDRRRELRRPQQARLDRLGVQPKRFVKEVPYVDPADVLVAEGEDAPDEVRAGAEIGVGCLKDVALVDIRGTTKGRGFTGTIKRFGFGAGDHSHGSKNVREPGSTGMHTDPGRIFKGKRMPGHHGAAPRKTRNLKVVQVDEEKGLLLVRGAVPGPTNGYVYIEESLS